MPGHARASTHRTQRGMHVPSAICNHSVMRRPGRCTPSIMVSMMTAVTVCAVLAFMTVAPMSRPRLCATRVTSTVANQLQKNAAGVKRRPPCMWRDTSMHPPNRGIQLAVPKSRNAQRQTGVWQDPSAGHIIIALTICGFYQGALSHTAESLHKMGCQALP